MKLTRFGGSMIFVLFLILLPSFLFANPAANVGGTDAVEIVQTDNDVVTDVMNYIFAVPVAEAVPVFCFHQAVETHNNLNKTDLKTYLVRLIRTMPNHIRGLEENRYVYPVNTG